ncbi:pentapeptide repeat-containing protein [Microcoleus sp. N3A4]|uniref:pentapeptide repeat-containing protein n=1 Tax=Microcoleus sp. N3A4 TaxID=3055379 RepID=UPI002FD2B051
MGSVLLRQAIGLATGATAANPQQVDRLQQTNQCPRCDLRSIPLGHASLANAYLQRADLRRANFREAN